MKELVQSINTRPHHVAIIMDGNGRWARLQGKDRHFGHMQGARTVERILDAACQYKIDVLTLFAFGKDNWRRSPQEVSALMSLYAQSILEHLPRLHQEGIRLSFIGDCTELDLSLQQHIHQAAQLTENNSRLHLVIAINYSGQWDLTQAFNQMFASEISLPISEDDIAKHLQTADLPEPDLLIRTSGEQRLSNFLLWQMAYTELYFTEVMWPDFQQTHFEAALKFYASRERRFGHEASSMVEDGYA